ncbi:MAG TPA: YciI family protein [Solirubrobacteraceae bacterium]|jgi:hypothetical protein
MQYALLIYLKPGAFEALSDEERAAESAKYWAIREEPGVLGGAGLAGVEAATTVRVQDGQTLVTDGPFADTKEVFGGYYTFEGDDLDAAIALAAKIPAVHQGGSIEVRPVLEGHS